jgi:hypothetical protein
MSEGSSRGEEPSDPSGKAVSDLEFRLYWRAAIRGGFGATKRRFRLGTTGSPPRKAGGARSHERDTGFHERLGFEIMEEFPRKINSMSYRSSFELLGIPFVHVAMTRNENGVWKRGVARGWIAIGDVAFGILFSMGGAAFGGIAFGGLSLGAIAFGGLALGGYTIGGLALGYLAIGGLAIGIEGAIGGGAIAKEFALGGLAIAEHANDEAAKKFFSEGAAGFGRALMDHSEWFLLLAFLPLLGGRRSGGTSAPRS